jgi:Cu+-exporting ATPase
LEQGSEHPLAAAIVLGAKARGVVIAASKDFRSVTAGGVVGTVGGREVMIGKPGFLRDEGVTGLESLESSTAKWEEGMATFFKPFTKATVRYFDHADVTESRKWLEEA